MTATLFLNSSASRRRRRRPSPRALSHLVAALHSCVACTSTSPLKFVSSPHRPSPLSTGLTPSSLGKASPGGRVGQARRVLGDLGNVRTEYSPRSNARRDTKTELFRGWSRNPSFSPSSECRGNEEGGDSGAARAAPHGALAAAGPLSTPTPLAAAAADVSGAGAAWAASASASSTYSPSSASPMLPVEPPPHLRLRTPPKSPAARLAAEEAHVAVSMRKAVSDSASSAAAVDDAAATSAVASGPLDLGETPKLGGALRTAPSTAAAAAYKPKHGGGGGDGDEESPVDRVMRKYSSSNPFLTPDGNHVVAEPLGAVKAKAAAVNATAAANAAATKPAVVNAAAVKAAPKGAGGKVAVAKAAAIKGAAGKGVGSLAATAAEAATGPPPAAAGDTVTLFEFVLRGVLVEMTDAAPGGDGSTLALRPARGSSGSTPALRPARGGGGGSTPVHRPAWGGGGGDTSAFRPARGGGGESTSRASHVTSMRRPQPVFASAAAAATTTQAGCAQGSADAAPTAGGSDGSSASDTTQATAAEHNAAQRVRVGSGGGSRGGGRAGHDGDGDDVRENDGRAGRGGSGAGGLDGGASSSGASPAATPLPRGVALATALGRWRQAAAVAAVAAAARRTEDDLTAVLREQAAACDQEVNALTDEVTDLTAALTQAGSDGARLRWRWAARTGVIAARAARDRREARRLRAKAAHLETQLRKVEAHITNASADFDRLRERLAGATAETDLARRGEREARAQLAAAYSAAAAATAEAAEATARAEGSEKQFRDAQSNHGIGKPLSALPGAGVNRLSSASDVARQEKDMAEGEALPATTCLGDR